MLEDFLRDHHFEELHRISCSAPPAAVMRSARELTPRELPLLVVLMAIRGLPALARGRRLRVRGTIVDAFRRGGFVVLEDTPDELVLGTVGRFWQAAGGIRRIEPDRFRGFDEPGWAKVAFSFRVEQIDGVTVLQTETRVLATDEGARRRFGRYWRLVRPGSGGDPGGLAARHSPARSHARARRGATLGLSSKPVHEDTISQPRLQRAQAPRTILCLRRGVP